VRWPDIVWRLKVDGITYNPTDGEIHNWPSLSMDENLEVIVRWLWLE